MHKKLNNSVLLLSRRKYIIKPTNTLSESSTTNLVTIRPVDRTIYAKSLSDSATLLDLSSQLSSCPLVFVSSGVASYQPLESTALIKLSYKSTAGHRTLHMQQSCCFVARCQTSIIGFNL